MEWISFLKQYIRSPKTVGAVLPSSAYLAEKMVEGIDFKRAKCIVEYGPGTGVFTEKLVENKEEDTVIILIEYNYGFYSILKSKYKNHDNIYVINDSAENMDKYLEKYNIPSVDYIVSGLPFASLSKAVSSKILNTTKNILSEDGRFITFQYTLFKKFFINEFFEEIDVKREFKNFPPAYVLSCKN
ncbi:MAG: class I SAM-dependent methyltransferase [Clostridiaceae bacterium]